MPGTPDRVSNGVVLGFDFGECRIGVAVGQTITGTATPLLTLTAHHGQPDWQQVSALLEEWQPVVLVVGLPLQLDGSPSAISEAAQRFARRLQGRYNRPVQMMDERLSSQEAQLARSQRGKRGKNQALDPLAAQIIVQNWLEQNGDYT